MSRMPRDGRVLHSKVTRMCVAMLAAVTATLATLAGAYPLLAGSPWWEGAPCLAVAAAGCWVVPRALRSGAFRDAVTGELVVRNYFRTYVYPPATEVVVKEVWGPLPVRRFAPAVLLDGGRSRPIMPLQVWDVSGDGAVPARAAAWAAALNR